MTPSRDELSPTDRRPPPRGRLLVPAAGLLCVAALLLPAMTAGASPSALPAKSTKNCSDMATIAKCVMAILSPANGSHGVYLRQVGGPVLAEENENLAYEPASSIKPVIALYAMTQVEKGAVELTTEIPKINESNGPDGCPPNSFDGTEPLGTALQQMLQVSDNNRTDELMQYFGVRRLNAFAASLGLGRTMFHTSKTPPGFNVIGCISYGFNPLPRTVDGNTMSLANVAKLWGDIADLPTPYAAAFAELAAGRDMFNSEGYDFTGVWPSMVTIADEEAPRSLAAAEKTSFVDHMSVTVKGGNYNLIDCPPSGCKEATWWVFAGAATIPACHGSTVTSRTYTWGYFIDDATQKGGPSADDTTAGVAFFKASGQLLAAPMAAGLAGWSKCAPMVRPALRLSAKALTSGHSVPIATSLASLGDSDRTDIAADLDGTIGWGDGTPDTAATVSGDDGSFSVHGWHAYARAGTYTVTIIVHDVESGKSARSTVKLKVT